MKGPTSRRIVTVAVTVLILLALVVVGTTVQVPFVALGPGPTVNTLGTIQLDNREVPVVDISGAPTQRTDGNLNLTTVSVTDGLSLFQTIGMWLSGTYSVQPRETVFPPDQTTEQTNQQNAEDMSNSESTAQAAALRYLDRPTELVAALVTPDGPASSVLRSGDVILKVGGTAVMTTEDLQKAVRAHKPGDEIAVEIRRGGAAQAVTVKAAARPGEQDVAYIGVTPEVRNADPNLKITFNVGDIGGPSAGLMLTLAVIDRLGTKQLTHGKFIAGTGTIADDGKVGPIGGITHKTRAARDAGATVFLVPDQNCAEAAGDAPDGLQLVKVESVDSAVDSLDALAAGKPVPHC
ncbi:PDZ domain-containing protein [Gordonia oryzae]|uniref:endopeptidase La n=1 Tax=Gordonia oryzae TaxID=2487349 RepID=A0A3N4GPM7_9ACTN|nr:PDZ domain-containing protein [Gordonia oryzae]RPA61041.1 PDZ domain-containing protein [Gordonia oryzae]